MVRVDSSTGSAVADLNQLADDLVAGAAHLPTRVSAITRKTSGDIEAMAKTLVPVDTGATRSSIGFDIEESGGPDDYQVTAEGGPQTWYAPLLEAGTESMPPRPYMGPSFDRYVPDWVKALELAVVVLEDP